MHWWPVYNIQLLTIQCNTYYYLLVTYHLHLAAGASVCLRCGLMHALPLVTASYTVHSAHEHQGEQKGEATRKAGSPALWTRSSIELYHKQEYCTST